MFMTEAQRALYKYQSTSKYFNDAMANIVSAELDVFFKNLPKNANIDFIGLLDGFLHKRVNDSIWEFYFSDNSRLTVYEKVENGQKSFSCQANCYGYADADFVEEFFKNN